MWGFKTRRVIPEENMAAPPRVNTANFVRYYVAAKIAALEERLDRKFETIDKRIALTSLVAAEHEKLLIDVAELRSDVRDMKVLFEFVPGEPEAEIPFNEIIDRETGELSPKLADLTASGRVFKVVVDPVPPRLELRLPVPGRRPQL